jgi:hypothetical protein
MKLTRRFDIQKFFLLGSLYGFSFLLLAMGLGVCLIKSPADKAQNYQALAQHQAQLQENALQADISTLRAYKPVRMFVLSQNDSQTLTR